MQGFNMGRYVPPEFEGTTFANKLAGKHALGNRARKAGQGILTVRFEMPFPIWCTTCPKPTIIGQGVRFNAEKKKVGNYYTTPIYSFRMKHTACSGWIEIRTDPQNTAYVVTSGAKKRDLGNDKPPPDGTIEIRTDEEKERLRNDAFAALEVTIDDRKQATADKARIDDLLFEKDKDWEDPYAASKKLRKTFRAERKLREKSQAATENLQERMSLGLDLLPESDDDRRRAALVQFGDVEAAAAGQGGDKSIEAAVKRAQTRDLFAAASASTTKIPTATKKPTKPNGKLKAAREAEVSREKLKRELGANTRAALDPFLTSSSLLATAKLQSSSTTAPTLGIKRKREPGKQEEDVVVALAEKESSSSSSSSPSSSYPLFSGRRVDDENANANAVPVIRGLLVDYESDSGADT